MGEKFQSRVQAILEAQQQARKPSTGDALLQNPAPSPAPSTALSTPVLNLPLYTPEAMVEHLLANPGLTHAQYARAFGRTPSWFASVLASDAFQSALAPYKDQLHDPAITASMEERLRGLAMRSLLALQDKLDGPSVSDQTILAAATLGVKGLGLGNAAPALAAPAVASGAEAVADRIMAAMASARDRANKSTTVDVEAKEVPSGS